MQFAEKSPLKYFEGQANNAMSVPEGLRTNNKHQMGVAKPL
jgi:hypothetical protein